MKIILKKICSLALITILIFTMTGCGNSNKIKTLMKDFENACNKLDLNAMLECVNPEVAEGIKLAAGLMGMFSDKDSDELLDRLATILLKKAPENTHDFFGSIKIDVGSIEEEGDAAKAEAIVKYNISGEEYENETVFECILIEDEWYISDFNIQ